MADIQGQRITALTEDTTPATGDKIIRGGEAVAQYGEAVVIGKEDESRARIDKWLFNFADVKGG